jgi:hypothetical protein
MIISLPKSMRFRFVSLATMFCLVLSCISWTVRPPQATSGTTPQSRTVLRTFAPFWQIGDGFSSTLIVRNVARQSSVSATPIVFTADKKQLRLPAIQLAPSEVKKISLEEALQTAGSSAETGALALELETSQSAAIIGELVITDYQHGVIFDLPLHAGYANDEAKALHAAWWLPDDKTQGTVVLFNASEQAISVHPSVTIDFAQHTFEGVTLAAHETRKLDLRDLVQQSGHRNADLGSISLSYEGPAHALLPALLLANEKTGFSLTGKFFVKRPEQANQSSTVNWHYPAVFAGKADPSLGFKKGSKFTPYALISNHTSNVIAPQLEASFTANDRSTQSVSLTVNPLLPLETRLIDLADVTKELIPKNASSFSLQLSHSGRAGDLALHVFSVDQKKDFVFTAEGTMQTRGRLDSLYWNIADDLQAMLVVQNTGGSTVQAQATLSYDTNDGGQGTYKLPPLEIPARATRIVNLKQIITSGQPDEAGQVIPAGTSLGSATIEVTGGQTGGPDNDVLAGGSVTFDPDTGRCGGDVLPICGPDERPQLDGSCELIISIILITVCELFCEPPCAVPTNFHLTNTSGFDAGNGTLHVVYGWQSSTGTLSDLGQCTVAEKVDYNNADLPFASPPFPAGINPPNPTILPSPPVRGTDGAIQDNHSTPGAFVKPYSAKTITSTQVYRYTCGCANSGQPVVLYGPLSIVRSVSQNSDSSWKFVITKDGKSATINPLP